MQQDSWAPYLYHQGTNYETYEYLGAHRLDNGDVVFRVWAPNAREVYVFGDFNDWNETSLPMNRITDGGIYECVVSGVKKFDGYKYHIISNQGTEHFKSDPYAFHWATRPETNSKFYELDGYEWGDKAWVNRKFKDSRFEPMNIYELHAGTWQMHEDGNFLNYRELADRLSEYLLDMGYTHVELLPITEYPFDGSWGYQVTGYFAPTSRYGTPDDFMYFIDKMHQSGIAVILDWVPAHFPKDAFGLYRFDGSCCYEDPNPIRGEHKNWGTVVFDYGKPEIQSFLVSSAMFWFKKYHIDGIRVDAVAAMLYLDHDRPPGEWQPNNSGGRENLEATAFIQKLNSAVLSAFPNGLMIAEESTAWPLVTQPPYLGGLGFSYKWNMGWMNDTLSYFKLDPFFRKDHHGKLTFSMMYVFSENYVLPISHDEVVHGKLSLINRMPGSYEQKFSGHRAFLAYMMAHPGKKLNFMGYEFGQFIEWNEKQELDWLLLDYPAHRILKDFVKDLNHLYLDNPPLWQVDNSWDGFRWVVSDDNTNNVLSFIRYDKRGRGILCVYNLSAADLPDYRIGIPDGNFFDPLLDTDDEKYGGRSAFPFKKVTVEEVRHFDSERSARFQLPALSARYYKLSRRKPAKPAKKTIKA